MAGNGDDPMLPTILYFSSSHTVNQLCAKIPLITRN